MKILAVDSSSVTASVALVEDETIISEFFINSGLTHSQTLAPMVKSVLDLCAIQASQVDLFAVTSGPGSFTGLRIGVACVKAMALANQKPCIGISSLYALARNLNHENAIICSCMDARRESVYNALFKRQNGKIIRLTPDRAITIENLIKELQELKSEIYFVGDGASDSYEYALNSLKHGSIFLSPLENRYIEASNIAFAAKALYETEENIDDACSLALNYLKVSQAERLLKENKLHSQAVN